MPETDSASVADAPLTRKQLQALLADPELGELERKFGRFSIFRVLRSDNDELRHSNTLAWLRSPDEPHGLATGSSGGG